MCPGIQIKAKDGSVIYARTMEFDLPLKSDAIAVQRKYKFTGKTPDGKQNGLSWETKYASVGVNALDEPAIADGLNEVGLAVRIFYFRGYAEFQEVSEKDYPQTIAPEQFGIWALSQFATVEEVKEALLTVKVGKGVFGPFGFVVPVHYVIHDSKGDSLVVEYVKGQITYHDNPLGVMANSPTFDWQMTNLRNYINLSPINVPPVEIGDIKLEQFGEGSGLLGLPGDFTPPSRLVRATVFSQTTQAVLPPETGQ